MKFIVFGLGNFGASLANKLVKLGHEVIGVDNHHEITEKWKDQITHVIALDASSPDAMRTLPLKDVDAVIVAIGEKPGIGIMVAALLKQMGVKRIISRVITPLQRTVLETMNIREFADPESDSAERLAYQLDLKGVVNSHRVTDKFGLIEVEVPGVFVGSKISEIDFQKEFGITLVTILRTTEEKNIFGVIHPVRESMGIIDKREVVLTTGDTLLLFGEVSKLERFIES
jgi:trk system potassium uptake protein